MLEGSKENIQPTRRGYDPRALARSLKPPTSPSSPSSSSSLLSTQRTSLESSILSYDGPDPLHPWLRYLQWTLSSYPSLSQSSNLLPLLEKCTRTFLDSPQYLNDRRYVQVWLLYAERCPQPGDVFQFLHSRGIGSKVSQKFTEWAAWHEKLGRLQEAEAALQLGMDCSAQPSNALRIAMKQLNARNAERIRQQLRVRTADVLDPLSDVALAAMNDAPTRRVLSSLSSAAPSAVAQQSQPRPQSHHSAAPLPTSAPSIPIFTDTSPSSTLPQGGWKQLPSQSTADKENQIRPSTWTTPLAKSTSTPHHIGHTRDSAGAFSGGVEGRGL